MKRHTCELWVSDSTEQASAAPLWALAIKGLDECHKLQGELAEVAL